MTILNNKKFSPLNNPHYKIYKIDELFTKLISFITDEEPNIENITEESKKLLKYFQNNKPVDSYDPYLINYHIKKIERIILTSIDKDKVTSMNIIINRINYYTKKCNSLYSFEPKLLIISAIPKDLKDLLIPESPKRPTARPPHATSPTASPTTRPTTRPTARPTARPPHVARSPTASPTARPTARPPHVARSPTARPPHVARSPTARPTASPTTRPTASPTASPTYVPRFYNGRPWALIPRAYYWSEKNNPHFKK